MWAAAIAGKRIFWGDFLQHHCFPVRHPCNLAISQSEWSGEGVLGIVCCQLFHLYPLDLPVPHKGGAGKKVECLSQSATFGLCSVQGKSEQPLLALCPPGLWNYICMWLLTRLMLLNPQKIGIWIHGKGHLSMFGLGNHCSVVSFPQAACPLESICDCRPGEVLSLGLPITKGCRPSSALHGSCSVPSS